MGALHLPCMLGWVGLGVGGVLGILVSRRPGRVRLLWGGGGVHLVWAVGLSQNRAASQLGRG